MAAFGAAAAPAQATSVTAFRSNNSLVSQPLAINLALTTEVSRNMLAGNTARGHCLNDRLIVFKRKPAPGFDELAHKIIAAKDPDNESVEGHILGAFEENCGGVEKGLGPDTSNDSYYEINPVKDFFIENTEPKEKFSVLSLAFSTQMQRAELEGKSAYAQCIRANLVDAADGKRPIGVATMAKHLVQNKESDVPLEKSF